ncbi:MAG: DMT family transporter [Desulfobacterales bacterium]|nr:DMT family transporter [Desulfobacterales bacterium]
MTFKIALNVARKMSKKLMITGAILMLSMLVMQFNRSLGIILMMLYSSWMVIKSSKNEMPLGKITAILPGTISLCCFLFMLWFIGVYRPMMPLIGIILGIAPGFLMARGHQISIKNGKPYAKRTYFYILIWAASLLFIQGSTLLGLRKITEFGFLLNGFSTTMAVILSLFLVKKANTIKKINVGTGQFINVIIPVCTIIFAMFLWGTGISAETTFSSGNASSLGTFHGEPPTVNGSGVRYGQTEYKAILNPRVANLLESRKKRWFNSKISTGKKNLLVNWSFSGGRLIVDWDKRIATLEPIYFSCITAAQYDYDPGKIKYFKSSVELSLKKQSDGGNSLNMLGVDTSGNGGYSNMLPVMHGFGYPVIIGDGYMSSRYTSDREINSNGQYLKQPVYHGIGQTDFHITNNFPKSAGDKSNRKVSGNNTLLMQLQQGNYFRENFAIEQGVMETAFGCLIVLDNALKAINAEELRPADYRDKEFSFVPVKTIGREPATPHLISELKPQNSSWTKRDVTGTKVYKGRFLRAAPSPNDMNSAAKICAALRNAVCEGAELKVDWDKRKATLSPFLIRWDILTYNGAWKNTTSEAFSPVKSESGKITFNASAFQYIADGELNYSYQNKRVPLASSHDSSLTTFNPVAFKGKPVSVQWQAIPWDNDSILVRVYARPFTNQLRFVESQYYLPAYYDILFEQHKAVGSNKIEPAPDVEDTKNEISRSEPSETKSSQDRLQTDQNDEDLLSAIEQVLNTIEQSVQNIGFSEGAVAAGLTIAIIQLLGGLGMTAAYISAIDVAAAIDASVSEAQQELYSQPDVQDRNFLIDENGERWESNDEGLFGVEYDGKTEWMTREKAEQSIQKELESRHEREEKHDGQDPSSAQGWTEMLDGTEAQAWLIKNGYLYENGQPTLLFQDWQKNPDRGSLHGIAGYEGANGDMTDSVILISRGEPAQQEPEIQNKEQQSEEDRTDTQKVDAAENQVQDTQQSDEKVHSTKEPTKDTQQEVQEEIDDDRPPDVDRHNDELLPDEPEPYKPPGPTTPEQVATLKDKIQETVDDKKMEGYYVRNREFDVLPVVDQALWAGNKAINNIGNWVGSPVDGAMGWTGGQCGEYGEWGIKWSEKACKDTFGEGTIMTQITAESGTSNHNATRVITPNGDRFVIDYWQGMQDRQTVYTEEEWIQQQTKAGRPDIVRSWSGDKADILGGGEEGALNNYINKYGEKEGIEKFRSGAAKGEDMAKREALILSYQKSPWPTK